MIRVDAHHHFWDPATADYPWMSDEVAVLVRRFGPDHLQPRMRRAGLDFAVTVQARAELRETHEFLRFAAENAFIAGVVGWVDLTDERLDDTLAELRERPDSDALVGIRHQVEDEPDPDWLRRDDVRRGLAAIQRSGLVYDLLVRPPNLPSAIDTVREFPETRFVVDHIAKPLIATGELEPWASGLRELSKHDNVWCKLSGLVTEADRDTWTVADLVPYVEHVFDVFGPERLIYGSDWPVCLLADCTYERALESTIEAMPDLSAAEQEAVLGTNAIEVYRLEDRVTSGRSAKEGAA